MVSPLQYRINSYIIEVDSLATQYEQLKNDVRDLEAARVLGKILMLIRVIKELKELV